MRGFNMVVGVFSFLLVPITALNLVDDEGAGAHSNTPPRGWNSYDSYSWVISEQEFLANAQLVSQKLLPFGYQYVVVDFLWYRKLESGASVTTRGFDYIDEWGRPMPDPVRWPSSIGGQGLKPIADSVHSMGLKFGIHVMRGISTQAVEDNTPVLGQLNRTWRARDIALETDACSWMPECFLRVNESTEGGKAFIKSLYDLYASWEVDFVKHDCVFGVDLSLEEVTTVSEAILSTGRPMVYSISPGVEANPSMATLVNGFVNMYRITGDDWDSWHDLESHFDAARDFAAASLIGAAGLLGFSWPDLDMLPLGFLTTPGANHGPSRWSRLSPEEQKTQMTLWAMVKSPLMFGGDMLNMDNATINILTNPIALEINAHSFGNMEVQICGVLVCNKSMITRLHGECTRGSCWKESYGMASSRASHLYIRDKQREGRCCLLEPSSATMKAQSVRQAWKPRNSQSYIDAGANSQKGSLVSNDTELCEPANGGLKLAGTPDDPWPSVNIRVWMAFGMKGEYYIALFNLKEEAVEVSVPIAGIVDKRKRVHPPAGGRQGFIRADGLCRGREAWSNRNVWTVKNRLDTELAPHGCALFSLYCA